MDDNTRIVLVRLIKAPEKLGKPIAIAAAGGAILSNLKAIMDIVVEALKFLGGG